MCRFFLRDNKRFHFTKRNAAFLPIFEKEGHPAAEPGERFEQADDDEVLLPDAQDDISV